MLTPAQPLRSDAATHDFVDMEHYNFNSVQRLEEILDNSVNYDQLLRRLLTRGYDLAASTGPETRHPVGRCWQLYYEDAHVGCLWDYPGQFSGLTWQPLPSEAGHSQCTLTIYGDERVSSHLARAML